MATYEKMRGPVFSLCGYKAVQMLDSAAQEATPVSCVVQSKYQLCY